MLEFMMHFKGDHRAYLQKKARLLPSNALIFALDIAKQVEYYTRVCKFKSIYVRI